MIHPVPNVFLNEIDVTQPEMINTDDISLSSKQNLETFLIFLLDGGIRLKAAHALF